MLSIIFTYALSARGYGGEMALMRVTYVHGCAGSLSVEVTSVKLLFPVQRFVVPVQQNLTDWGLRVPTLTLVVK